LKKLKIIYLTYWGIDDSLTHAAAFPHINILNDHSFVEKVILVTIERTHRELQTSLSIRFTRNAVTHIPMQANKGFGYLFNKLLDFVRLPKLLNKLVADNEIDLIIAAGTHAGTIALKASPNNTPPVIVSYFDPHAEYMRYGGTWAKFDIRYLYLKKWETKLLKKASAVFAVSRRYQNYLMDKYPNLKVLFVPCSVNIEKFKFDVDNRLKIRKKLGIKIDTLVGIYVGKFGDLYMDEEGFELFSYMKVKSKKKYFQIILSPQNLESIKDKLISKGFQEKEFFVGMVSHDEIPDYLSASDFAYCLQKPHKFSFGFSPIKNGEYWASGLPLVIKENIGDDSEIVVKEKIGAIWNQGEKLNGELFNVLNNENHRQEINKISKTYRSRLYAQKAFDELLMRKKSIS